MVNITSYIYILWTKVAYELSYRKWSSPSITVKFNALNIKYFVWFHSKFCKVLATNRSQISIFSKVLATIEILQLNYKQKDLYSQFGVRCKKKYFCSCSRQLGPARLSDASPLFPLYFFTLNLNYLVLCKSVVKFLLFSHGEPCQLSSLMLDRNITDMKRKCGWV